jgi:gluconate 2-dehydrogenase gamma chain
VADDSVRPELVDHSTSLTVDPEPAERVEERNPIRASIGSARTSARESDRRRLSRRELLKRASLVGTAAPLVSTVSLAPAATASAVQPGQTSPSPREALETLTAAESDILEAIVARLIPTDAQGPGAAEARAAHYIDRVLAGPSASLRGTYAAGLAAVDAYSQASKRAPFAKLSAKEQDAVLTDMENNVATGFTPDSATFFELLRAHTIDGTFCDPYYGGNANFIGWDLIKYPGVRMAVTPDQQRTPATFAANHRSAYDFPLFSKKRIASAHQDPTRDD